MHSSSHSPLTADTPLPVPRVLRRLAWEVVYRVALSAALLVVLEVGVYTLKGVTS